MNDTSVEITVWGTMQSQSRTWTKAGKNTHIVLPPKDDEGEKQACALLNELRLFHSVLPFLLHNPTCVALQYPGNSPRASVFVPATVANNPYPRLHLAFRPGRCLTGPRERRRKKGNGARELAVETLCLGSLQL